LNPLVESHFSTFDEKDLPGFMKKLDAYQGATQTKIAIKLLMHTFVRPSEMVGAKWEEFDLDNSEWRIPAGRMKMRQGHIVPLAKQVVRSLEELHTLTGYSSFLFPGERSPLSRSMARDTLSKALRTMGCKGQATPHGFRAMASTMLNERGFHPDVIERQLAHKEANKIRAAYNRARYLAERTKMMQHWADFLEGVAKDDRIVPFKKSVA
jgi:integrase